MRLLEYSTSLLLRQAYSALAGKFKLERVGGEQRVYKVANELGVVYLVGGGPKAVGLTWQKGSSALSKVFVWNTFNAAKSPDAFISVPAGFIEEALEAILDFVAHPHVGLVETQTVTPKDFITMVKNSKLDPKKITYGDMNNVAVQNNVLIPREFVSNQMYHTGDDFNLTAKVALPRKFYIMAKSADGVMFEVPGTQQMAARLEHAFAEANGNGDDEGTMEEQYQKLREKVELVAGNKSTYIKSLLITGAPSSGKTYTVMETVKSLGLVEGKDYIVIKGTITDAALYQTFIEQIDSLTIFDDCDSVAGSTDGKNMLKNALDTYEVRDIGRPNANSLNTKQMKQEEREEFVNAISRILRGQPAPGDLARFDAYLPKKKKKEAKEKEPVGLAVKKRKIIGHRTSDDGWLLPIFDGDDMDGDSDKEKLIELQRYFQNFMPNRIDFRGRIIFISNMKESEWDSAILTRAFRQNMNFSDDEMLDFIDKIKNGIAAPQLTPEQKDEVLAFIRQCHETGQLNSPINFRLVQQAFDLRLCSTWKSMIQAL